MCIFIDPLHFTSLPPCWKTITKDCSLAFTVSSTNMADTSLSFALADPGGGEGRGLGGSTCPLWVGLLRGKQKQASGHPTPTTRSWIRRWFDSLGNDCKPSILTLAWLPLICPEYGEQLFFLVRLVLSLWNVKDYYNELGILSALTNTHFQAIKALFAVTNTNTRYHQISSPKLVPFLGVIFGGVGSGGGQGQRGHSHSRAI